MKVKNNKKLAVLFILLISIIIPLKVQAATNTSIDVSTTEEFIEAAHNEEIQIINVISDEIDFKLSEGTKVLDVTGKIINLNNHTITTDNMAFVLEGNQFTIKNGTIDAKGQSYSLFIGDAGETNYVTIENIVGIGGFNIFNANNVVIKNCEVTGKKYYAIWCDEGGQATIESGTYVSGETALFGMAPNECETKLEIKGGNHSSYGKPLVLQGKDENEYGKPEISDGTFDVPVDMKYCKSGYEPVSIGTNQYSVCNHASIKISNSKEATCTENGYTGDSYCIKCGKKVKSGSSIAAKGHSLVHHGQVLASCVNNGAEEYWSCSKCSKNFKDENARETIEKIEIPALGHIVSEWKSDEKCHWKECTREGCKTIISETKGAHIKRNGKCEICLREMPVKIENIVDDKTNIKLEYAEGVIPDNVVLEVKEIKNNTTYNKIKESLPEVKKFELFDINLLKNGIKIQPNGKVKISIPIQTGFDKSELVVYRIGEKSNIEYEVTVVEIKGKEFAQFETDHFSYYILAERMKANNKPIDKEHQLEDEPKTGTVGNKIGTTVLLAVASIGYVVCKKKIHDSLF